MRLSVPSSRRLLQPIRCILPAHIQILCPDVEEEGSDCLRRGSDTTNQTFASTELCGVRQCVTRGNFVFTNDRSSASDHSGCRRGSVLGAPFPQRYGAVLANTCVHDLILQKQVDELERLKALYVRWGDYFKCEKTRLEHQNEVCDHRMIDEFM